MPYVAVDDVKIYYEIHGQPQGETVVFLHGLGSSHRDWELQLPQFTADYRVLVMDCRGHGNSDKPPGPYSMAQFARDFAVVFMALEVFEAHIVGLSMGGMIAFQLAVDFPQYIRTLTIVNSSPSVVPVTLADHFKVASRFLLVRLLGMRKMGEVLAKKLFVEPQQNEIRKIFVERWSQNDPVAYVAAMKAIVGWSVEDHLETITQPTLVLTADQDYTPVSAKAAYVAKLPCATLQIVEDARHAVSVERPEAFNTLVYRFIRSCGR